MSENERDYILYLEDILNAINKIESYTKDLSFEDFSGNSMVIDAVIRNFEVIGE
ncbi:MAG: nucleotidyltransferase, partial [Nitrospirae bacterium GWA2_42_11]